MNDGREVLSSAVYMQAHRRLCASLRFMAASLLFPCVASAVTVRPVDDGRVLTNPGMGWTMHYYSNIPRNYGTWFELGDSLEWFPGCSVVYLRIPWAYLEPEEGCYNWNALDTPAQRWIERGGQIAFRITTSENWIEYATPKWVFDAGAKCVRYDFGWGEGTGPNPNGRTVDPDFVDPVFLAKLEKFIKAFAARYDGRPEVAFVDIGTYGLWGEGHTLGSSRVPQDKMNVDVKRHIDLHLKYFRRTPLVISDDVASPSTPDPNPELLAYARDSGVGWRDDSIMVEPPPMSWKHAAQAQLFWRKLPVVLEHEHFHSSLGRGAWREELLARAVEEHHASYMSIHGDPHQILASNKTAVATINRRLGYRFLPSEISWPDAVTVGENARPFTVSWSWKNLGVAPSYRPYYPCLTVKDERGRLMAVLADSGFDLSGLDPAAPGQARAKTHEAEFTLGRWFAPEMRPGTYDVFVSVGEVDGTPVVELPLPGDDGHRRYKVGKIVW